VNGRAEEFRGKLVSFEGKLELTVDIPGSLDSAPYELFLEKITAEIDRHLSDPEVSGRILPNFSTTTQDDRITCGVVLMATMKKYFAYRSHLFCGIPSITLEGTLDDWRSVKQKLVKLKSFGFLGSYSGSVYLCQEREGKLRFLE